MQVSVLICTWNRAAQLAQTLAQLRALEIPAYVSWEVVVVNNNSSDATAQVLTQFAQQLPLVARFEPRQGKSHACNHAVAAARGELLLWTDDDVLVDRHWLASYALAAERWPEAAFFGGAIEPHFLAPPPQWLLDAWPLVAPVYAERNPGPAAAPIRERDHLPYGANFAIRAAVQRQYSYQAALGPCGAGQVRGEETALLQQLLAEGKQGFWVPNARVRHCIVPERATREYLARYYFGAGQQDAVLASLANPQSEWPVWRRLQVGLNACVAEARYRCTQWFAPPPAQMRRFQRARRLWGEFTGLCSRSAA